MKTKPENNRLENFLSDIKNGLFQIPVFQRDFVWSNGQIIDLFDSILKGYPIGSLIVWQPKGDTFETIDELAQVKVNSTETNVPPCYVLDGRQRITALIGTLDDSGEFSTKLFVDLNDEEMRPFFKSTTTRDNLRYISLHDAYDSFSLLDYLMKLKQSKLSQERQKVYAEKAKRINRDLKDYEIGYTVVMDGSLEEAEEIFSRLNSKSTPISLDFMIQARMYDTNSKFLFGNSITDIKDSLVQYNFDTLKRDIILKCVYNHTETPFIDGKITLLTNWKGSELRDIMLNVKREVTLAVIFLYYGCGIIDFKLLPYNYQLIMLCMFFHTNPQPKISQLLELRKWFFYTTYCRYFTNTSLSIIREDIRRFLDYSTGHQANPIDYEDKYDLLPPESINFYNVRSKICIASYILNRNIKKQEFLKVCPLYPEYGKSVGNTFIYVNTDEIKPLSQQDSTKLLEYGITPHIMEYYNNNDIEGFISQRSEYLLEKETNLFTKVMNLQEDDEIELAYSKIGEYLQNNIS